MMLAWLTEFYRTLPVWGRNRSGVRPIGSVGVRSGVSKLVTTLSIRFTGTIVCPRRRAYRFVPAVKSRFAVWAIGGVTRNGKYRDGRVLTECSFSPGLQLTA